MKKLITTIGAVVITATAVFAQSPQKMSWQAVVRNAEDKLVTNSNVGVRISIIQDAPTGTPVYAETHNVRTNANGLATMEIGTGDVEFGEFSGIDWGNGEYYIATETDPKGGSNYSVKGTTQLVSVPYALYALNAGNSTSGATGATGA